MTDNLHTKRLHRDFTPEQVDAGDRQVAGRFTKPGSHVAQELGDAMASPAGALSPERLEDIRMMGATNAAKRGRGGRE